MAGWTADPQCPNCKGSGIEPGSGEDYGMPYGTDPSSYEPCACVLENDPDRPENWRYADRFVAQWVANCLNAGMDRVPNTLRPQERDRMSLEPGWSLAYQACGGMGGTRGWVVVGNGI